MKVNSYPFVSGKPRLCQSPHLPARNGERRALWERTGMYPPQPQRASADIHPVAGTASPTVPSNPTVSMVDLWWLIRLKCMFSYIYTKRHMQVNAAEPCSRTCTHEKTSTHLHAYKKHHTLRDSHRTLPLYPKSHWGRKGA